MRVVDCAGTDGILTWGAGLRVNKEMSDPATGGSDVTAGELDGETETDVCANGDTDD